MLLIHWHFIRLACLVIWSQRYTDDGAKRLIISGLVIMVVMAYLTRLWLAPFATCLYFAGGGGCRKHPVLRLTLAGLGIVRFQPSEIAGDSRTVDEAAALSTATFAHPLKNCYRAGADTACPLPGQPQPDLEHRCARPVCTVSWAEGVRLRRSSAGSGVHSDRFRCMITSASA